MEENTKIENEVEISEPKTGNSKSILIVSLIIVGLIIFSQVQKRGNGGATGNKTTSQTTEKVTAPSYKDGVYAVKGKYTSPGGEEQIDVKLTLKGNVVSDAEVVSLSERPISKKFQGEFVAGYKEQVVGKKIDDINVQKVSGSSLTPKGFKDALDQIKVQAKS